MVRFGSPPLVIAHGSQPSEHGNPPGRKPRMAHALVAGLPPGAAGEARRGDPFEDLLVQCEKVHDCCARQDFPLNDWDGASRASFAKGSAV